MLLVMFSIATSRMLLLIETMCECYSELRGDRVSMTGTYMCSSTALPWNTPAANEIGTLRVSSVVPTMLLLTTTRRDTTDVRGMDGRRLLRGHETHDAQVL